MPATPAPDPDPDRAATARATAESLRALAGRAADVPVMLGFDGFVDAIIDVVDKRHDVERYDAFATIDAFGQRVAAAAGQSSNFELVVKRRKLGGNGPIMANAMAALGLDVTYIGALGEPDIDPVFQELADRAHVHSVIANGTTDALEFADGKLMLGKYDHLTALTYDRIRERVGEDRFIEMVNRSRLVGMVNWTMLPGMDSIWQALGDRVLPAAPSRAAGERPIMFIDLADPEKRAAADLAAALRQCGQLARATRVVLGVNVKEASQVARALGYEMSTTLATDDELADRAACLREAMGIAGVVVHARRAAGAAVGGGADCERIEQGAFTGPFVRRPYLSTGAGDNFNAGFCLGLLAEMPLDHALCAGTAASGYYVRHGQSPTLDAIAAFCDDLPEPEADA